VWREGLDLLQLPVGAWLNEAKRAVRRGAPDDSRICVRNDLFVPLGVLKQHALRTARGHRIAYVVDAAFHESNIARITELARGADQLFIETAFLRACRRKAPSHRCAGRLARKKRQRFPAGAISFLSSLHPPTGSTPARSRSRVAGISRQAMSCTQACATTSGTEKRRSIGVADGAGANGARHPTGARWPAQTRP
jgi:hypothetical protein